MTTKTKKPAGLFPGYALVNLPNRTVEVRIVWRNADRVVFAIDKECVKLFDVSAESMNDFVARVFHDIQQPAVDIGCAPEVGLASMIDTADIADFLRGPRFEALRQLAMSEEPDEPKNN